MLKRTMPFCLLWCLLILSCISINHSTEIDCNQIKEDLHNALKLNDNYLHLKDYLVNNGITMTSETVAYVFFESRNITKEFDHLRLKSDIMPILSEFIAKRLYPDGVPPRIDLRAKLRKFTPCVKDFIKDFCKDPDYQRCQGRNIKFRTLDGSCTVPRNPKLGAAAMQFENFAAPVYEDGVHSYIRSVKSGAELPSPRSLINKFFKTCNESDDGIRDRSANLGGFMFSQFVVHDSSARAFSIAQPGKPGFRGCTADSEGILPAYLRHPYTAPMSIPAGDSAQTPLRCMNDIRTQTMVNNKCDVGPRYQLNYATSYLDLSQIYGASVAENIKFRTLEGGLLGFNSKGGFLRGPDNTPILPDSRATQTPPLAVIHLLFMREHNRIATEMLRQRPYWDDERLFQEARRWNIAQYQRIVIDELLPLVLGNKTHRLFEDGNTPLKDVDPTQTNEFSQSVWRYAHLFNPEVLNYFNESGHIVTTKTISDSIFSEDELDNQFDDVVRGLLYTPTLFNGCRDENINRLFKNVSFNHGLDLISLDINRGRDHGIAPYHVFLKLCWDVKVKKFADLAPFLPNEAILGLEEMYESVYDVDLLVGALLEERLEGTILASKTTSCIAREQFYRVRRGDPYFYDNPVNPNPFNRAQMKQLQKASFGRIICDNTEIRRLPKPAMVWNRPQPQDNFVTCDDYTRVAVTLPNT